MTGIQRKVVDADWESAAKIAHGRVVGSQVRWALKLECGHEAVRYDRSGRVKVPTKALCKKCVDEQAVKAVQKEKKGK